MSIQTATKAVDNFQKLVGDKWNVSLGTNGFSPGYYVTMSTNLPNYLTYFDASELFKTMPFIELTLKELEQLREYKKKADKELDTYRKMMPSVAASLSETGGYGV